MIQRATGDFYPASPIDCGPSAPVAEAGAGWGSALPLQLSHQPLRQLHGVVLAAVVGIDLEHVGEVESGQRRLEGRNVRAVIRRHDRLRVTSGEHPALLYPARRERRIDAGKVRQELAEDLIVTHLVEWIG